MAEFAETQALRSLGIGFGSSTTEPYLKVIRNDFGGRVASVEAGLAARQYLQRAESSTPDALTKRVSNFGRSVVEVVRLAPSTIIDTLKG